MELRRGMRNGKCDWRCSSIATLSAEIFFVHIGHGVLFWVVIGILAVELPWWASLLLSPLAVFSVAGWAYEARFVLPVATRLWRGENARSTTKTPKVSDSNEERNV